MSVKVNSYCFYKHCASRKKGFEAEWKSRTGQDSIHLWRPQKTANKEEWLKNLPSDIQQSFFESHKHVLCSLHFEEQCIIKANTYLVNDRTYSFPLVRWRLAPNAVPTIFHEGNDLADYGKLQGMEIADKIKNNMEESIPIADSENNENVVEEVVHPTNCEFSKDADIPEGASYLINELGLDSLVRPTITVITEQKNDGNNPGHEAGSQQGGLTLFSCEEVELAILSSGTTARPEPYIAPDLNEKEDLVVPPTANHSAEERQEQKPNSVTNPDPGVKKRKHRKQTLNVNEDPCTFEDLIVFQGKRTIHQTKEESTERNHSTVEVVEEQIEFIDLADDDQDDFSSGSSSQKSNDDANPNSSPPQYVAVAIGPGLTTVALKSFAPAIPSNEPGKSYANLKPVLECGKDHISKTEVADSTKFIKEEKSIPIILRPQLNHQAILDSMMKMDQKIAAYGKKDRVIVEATAKISSPSIPTGSSAAPITKFDPKTLPEKDKKTKPTIISVVENGKATLLSTAEIEFQNNSAIEKKVGTNKLLSGEVQKSPVQKYKIPLIRVSHSKAEMSEEKNEQNTMKRNLPMCISPGEDELHSSGCSIKIEESQSEKAKVKMNSDASPKSSPNQHTKRQTESPPRKIEETKRDLPLRHIAPKLNPTLHMLTPVPPLPLIPKLPIIQPRNIPPVLIAPKLPHIFAVKSRPIPSEIPQRIRIVSEIPQRIRIVSGIPQRIHGTRRANALGKCSLLTPKSIRTISLDSPETSKTSLLKRRNSTPIVLLSGPPASRFRRLNPEIPECVTTEMMSVLIMPTQDWSVNTYPLQKGQLFTVSETIPNSMDVEIIRKSVSVHSNWTMTFTVFSNEVKKFNLGLNASCSEDIQNALTRFATLEICEGLLNRVTKDKLLLLAAQVEKFTDGCYRSRRCSLLIVHPTNYSSNPKLNSPSSSSTPSYQVVRCEECKRIIQMSKMNGNI